METNADKPSSQRHFLLIAEGVAAVAMPDNKEKEVF